MKIYSTLKEIISKYIQFVHRPNWLQWNLFPKDEQPPTLSVFEMALYLIVFFVAYYFFIAINRIPYHTFSISAEKLSKERYIDTLLAEKDTSVYFCFHTAKIVLQIPRTSVFAADSIDVCTYEINEGRIKIENLNLVSDTASTLLTGGMSQYWRAVFDNEADYFDEAFRMLKKNHELYETNSIRGELKGISDVNLNHQFPTERLNNALYPNKRKQYSKNTNHVFRPFKLNMTNGDMTEYWDSILDNSIQINLKHYSVFWDKYIYHLRNNSKRAIERNKRVQEERAKDVLLSNIWSDNLRNGRWTNKYYFSLVSSINATIEKDKDRFIRDSLESCHFYTSKEYFRKYDETFQGSSYGIESYNANNNDHAIETQKYSTYNASNVVNYVSILSPGWFNLYDVSQGWYKILFNTGSIDSTDLTIDFIGATDFLPMKIEPDEKGSNYIKFTDPVKILQIRKEGLTFYAKFKELENRQIIRSFAVTAILSGLVIVFLTFIILSLYRGLRSFRTKYYSSE